LGEAGNYLAKDEKCRQMEQQTFSFSSSVVIKNEDEEEDECELGLRNVHALPGGPQTVPGLRWFGSAHREATFSVEFETVEQPARHFLGKIHLPPFS